ncbi:MAG: helix-turn-helix transcriptional regulator [Oscillospiraceae bacterium]|nr:helix-turn-helix transcriptional regulator [Oscillospiraceae bacterium]
MAKKRIPRDWLEGIQGYPLGYQLKRIRNYCGYSQMQEAELLGCKQPTISAWESGKTKPYGRLRERIIELYGLPTYYFSEAEIEHLKLGKKRKNRKD